MERHSRASLTDRHSRTSLIDRSEPAFATPSEFVRTNKLISWSPKMSFSPRRKSRRTLLAKQHRMLDPVQVDMEFGEEVDEVQLVMGDQLWTMEDGWWFSEDALGERSGSRKTQRARRAGVQHVSTRYLEENKKVTEQNNLLEVKVEVLTDMLVKMQLKAKKEYEVRKERERPKSRGSLPRETGHRKKPW